MKDLEGREKRLEERTKWRGEFEGGGLEGTGGGELEGREFGRGLEGGREFGRGLEGGREFGRESQKLELLGS